MDSHWVNICNAPSVISAGTDTGAAVAEAVRLTESKLKELNLLAQPVESPFIAAMIKNRREQYARNQTCTRVFLQWIDTQALREGVGANEAWNAGYACAEKAIAQPQQSAHPAPVAHFDVNQLAQEILRVDVRDDLCARALAEALMTFLSTREI